MAFARGCSRWRNLCSRREGMLTHSHPKGRTQRLFCGFVRQMQGGKRSCITFALHFCSTEMNEGGLHNESHKIPISPSCLCEDLPVTGRLLRRTGWSERSQNRDDASRRSLSLSSPPFFFSLVPSLNYVSNCSCQLSQRKSTNGDSELIICYVAASCEGREGRKGMKDCAGATRTDQMRRHASFGNSTKKDENKTMNTGSRARTSMHPHLASSLQDDATADTRR